MPDIRPFRGARFGPGLTDLGRALCPPYDAISPDAAEVLRREDINAIHIELPQGDARHRYRGAARIWRRWSQDGVLARDASPAFYVCEETYSWGGRRHVRRGFFAALSLSRKSAAHVVRHERTLSKPQADRLKLLDAVRVNVSPIFGIFPDPSGRVRRALQTAARAVPLGRGRSPAGTGYRLWGLSDGAGVADVRKALAGTRILIADGHHRYGAAGRYWRAARRAGAETILIYLCPEEDPGLMVLPTHRVVRVPVGKRAAGLCRVSACRDLGDLLKKLAASRNPYAFGMFGAGHSLAEPASKDGCKSGLSVEWLRRRLLRDVAPDRIRYTPDAALAESWAKECRGTALFAKPFSVPQVRKAAQAVGLLPEKTTYFYPKIATGLVFRPFE